MKSMKVLRAAVALTFCLGAIPAGAEELNRTILPIPEAPFQGKIGLTPADSEKDFPRQVEAPEGAPNVVISMTDDVGFAASEVFGGPIPTSMEPLIEMMQIKGTLGLLPHFQN